VATRRRNRTCDSSKRAVYPGSRSCRLMPLFQGVRLTQFICLCGDLICTSMRLPKRPRAPSNAPVIVTTIRAYLPPAHRRFGPAHATAFQSSNRRLRELRNLDRRSDPSGSRKKRGPSQCLCSNLWATHQRLAHRRLRVFVGSTLHWPPRTFLCPLILVPEAPRRPLLHI